MEKSFIQYYKVHAARVLASPSGVAKEDDTCLFVSFILEETGTATDGRTDRFFSGNIVVDGTCLFFMQLYETQLVILF